VKAALNCKAYVYRGIGDAGGGGSWNLLLLNFRRNSSVIAINRLPRLYLDTSPSRFYFLGVSRQTAAPRAYLNGQGAGGYKFLSVF